jgi:response regulator NasT
MDELEGALRQISQLLPAPVVLIASREEEAVRLQRQETDIFAYLIRPFHGANLRQALAVAQAQFQRLHGARSEASQLRGAFADRKYIDRAKGILMQRRGVSEGEAYAQLREESRRLRTPIVEIARVLLGEAVETHEMRKVTSSPVPPVSERHTVSSGGHARAFRA